MQNKNSFFIIVSGIMLSSMNISAANIPFIHPPLQQKTMRVEGYVVHKKPKYNVLLPCGKRLTIHNYKDKANKLVTQNPHTKKWRAGKKEYTEKKQAKIVVLRDLGVRFGCLFCDESFSEVSKLATHVSRSRKYGCKPSYCCGDCNKKFWREDLLQGHKKECCWGKKDTLEKQMEDGEGAAAPSSADKDSREPGAAAFNDVFLNEKANCILKEFLGESGLVSFGYLEGDDPAFLDSSLERD